MLINNIINNQKNKLWNFHDLFFFEYSSVLYLVLEHAVNEIIMIRPYKKLSNNL